MGFWDLYCPLSFLLLAVLVMLLLDQRATNRALRAQLGDGTPLPRSRLPPLMPPGYTPGRPMFSTRRGARKEPDRAN
jgi:hypothetical protein